MVAPTCFGITLPSSGSVPNAFWEMLNWGAVERILWMGVLCLVTRCVRTTSLDTFPSTIFYRIAALSNLHYSGVDNDREDLSPSFTSKLTSHIITEIQNTVSVVIMGSSSKRTCVLLFCTLRALLTYGDPNAVGSGCLRVTFLRSCCTTLICCTPWRNTCRKQIQILKMDTLRVRGESGSRRSSDPKCLRTANEDVCVKW
jgi:hypothetical protein